MGFTPEQIKGRIKSVAKQNNADARTLMRIYMMERFLERLAQSEYRDNFIIKGGILVTAMIGVAHRSTMDIDTSMKNLNLSAEDTEKLNWLKLHDRKMKYHEIVDKYEAKNYVAQILGDRYIIPTYGVWERFEDIDFSTLPQKFAIKTTHDSCHYALVHNKNEMNINDIRKTIEDGLKKNHYYMCREWPYKDLRPRIIAEELISDNPPDDYKFFMFHGKMDSVMVCTERATGHPKFRFYDQDWNRLYYQKTDREPATDVKMPANFLEMIKGCRNVVNRICSCKGGFI